MHAGPLTSPRLRRLVKLLSDGKERSTRDLVRRTGVMAVGTCISELRAHGAEIDCSARFINGQRRFFYRMTKGPKEE